MVIDMCFLPLAQDLQKAYSPPVTDSSAWDARLGRAMLYAGSRVAG